MSFNTLLNQHPLIVEVAPDIASEHRGHSQAFETHTFKSLQNQCSEINSCIAKMPCLCKGEFSIPNSPFTQGIH